MLIADECVSALDALVQVQILELLESLQRRLKLSIVFITHDLRVAARLCDRIAVMHRGGWWSRGRRGRCLRMRGILIRGSC